MLATKARMRPIRLVIADRRPIVLQGFATLFAAEGDFTIVASCLDGASCLEAIRTLTPDLVLVEDGFSDVTASDMLAVVKAENIPTRLVFYIASVSHGDLAAAVAEGACGAISMREEPEALVQSLRLVAPARSQAIVGRERNGANGEAGLMALTDQERKIMRLIAYGMSNKQIARQLKVSPGTIKLRLGRISEQLGIKSRTEISAFALSRLYSALAALLYAALDDIRPADAAAFGHDLTDSLTVMTGDGTAETITIKINANKSMPSPVKTAKSVFKVGRVDNPIAETPARAGKPVQSSIDIGAGTITPQAPSSARAALSSFSAFVTTAVAIWISEVASSVAQASNLGDSLIALTTATESGTAELAAALHSPGNADAHLDNLAWFYPETDHQAFAFEPPGRDAIAGNDGAVQPVSADAGGGDVSSSDTPHVGSGSIDAVIDHGGVGQAAATDTSGNPPSVGMQATMEDESNPGQSQRDANDTKDGSVAAAQHAKHDTPDDKPNHGQTERDSHASEARPAAAEQHAKDDAKPAHGADADHSAQSHMPAAPDHGDSFHFKTETANSQASNKSEVHGGHAPGPIDDGLHTPGSHGLPPIQPSDLIGPSGAEQSDLHQANHAGHHLMHDLFV